MNVSLCFTLFIDDLPSNMSNVWFSQIFKNEGNIIDAYVSNKERRGKKLRFGFVKFMQEDEASRAISKNYWTRNKTE